MRRSTMLAKSVSETIKTLAEGGEPASAVETLTAALEAYKTRPDAKGGDKAKAKTKA